MADVARRAGVSTQTVSRCFTGTGYVSEPTRAKVEAAIAELGYVPNQAARGMRALRTNTVGVLSMGALNYGSAGVLTGIALAARREDVTVLVSQLDIDFETQVGWEREARRALDHFLAFPVDGVVLSTPVPGVEAILDGWDDATPIITVSEMPQSAEGSAGTHSYTAGLEATRHLVALGHREIIHVAGPASRNEARERERGYVDAITEAGLTPRVIRGAIDWSPASGGLAGSRDDLGEFTAVFAANDEIALGFMSAMESRGRRAPGDYSMVGVDDMPTAAYFSPPLTTMRLDFRELGRATFAMLREQILSGARQAHVTIEPELVARSSTSPPRR
ncbi:LacI family DNA-binding transcriptional regulator [Demequina sp. SYSU T00068]|uniref:LacI family DNA-binding transcriptional regulator n=1 Tax=Demequina lignilytica TaxID=3051663 RepID=UPI00262856A7|nr:LacI family DNA-binding transcriptional regulator [Demequina sp. SYSU T00068]MDN4491644.1 LacI family DNA-binding transcriptional regulator [Demequina sp. SYSU T00068]